MVGPRLRKRVAGEITPTPLLPGEGLSPQGRQSVANAGCKFVGPGGGLGAPSINRYHPVDSLGGPHAPQDLLLEVFCLVADELQALNLGRLRQRGPQPTLADR